MMFNMLNGHANNTDPRINYYFYRQVSETPGFDSAPDEEVLECGLVGYYVPPQLRGDDTPFCAPTNAASKPASGYWGRDHGNDDGTPPDGQKRTARGIYPGAGMYDDGNAATGVFGSGYGHTQRGGTTGGGGDGHMPVSYTHLTLPTILRV